MAKVPAGRYQAVVLEAKDATLIDYATLEPRRVSRLTMIQTLKGNVGQADKVKEATGRDVVVWDTLTYAAGPDGRMVTRIPERYVFDAHTQQPVHAGGENVDGTPVRRDGIEYKWPFLVEKRDYRYFDMMTRTTAPIHYRGGPAPSTAWTSTTSSRRSPGPRCPCRGSCRWASAPTPSGSWAWSAGTPPSACSGSTPSPAPPVNGEEIHREEMRWTGHPEKKPITAFDGHVRMRPDYVDAAVSLVKSQRQLVLLLTDYLPWAFAGLGTGLLALSLVLEARGRSRDRRAFGGKRAHDGGKPARPAPAGEPLSRGGSP
ncbi:hypothetical protein GCM10020000_61430 [Streptomyces olivoverticillatus]